MCANTRRNTCRTGCGPCKEGPYCARESAQLREGLLDMPLDVPSPYIFALASDLAYERDFSALRAKLASVSEVHGKWESFRLEQQANHLGHTAHTIINRANKQAIVAHRGTDLVADLASDWDIFLQRRPRAVAASKQYSETIKRILGDGYTIFETGHSLAAILAEYNAHLLGHKTVTFDSPGCREALERDADITEIRDDLVTAYLSAPNGINVAGQHVGQMIRLFVPFADVGGNQLSDLGIPPMGWLASMSSVVSRMSTEQIRYVKRQHSMKNILSLFDESIGHPFLQRKILTWPSLPSYANWLASSDAYDLHGWFDANASLSPQIRSYIQDLELRLEKTGFILGGFITPTFDRHIPVEDVRRYCVNAHHSFDNFYSDFKTRSYLSLQLGHESAYLPLQNGACAMIQTKKEANKMTIAAVATGGVAGGGITAYLYASAYAAKAALAATTKIGTAKLGEALAAEVAKLIASGAARTTVIAMIQTGGVESAAAVTLAGEMTTAASATSLGAAGAVSISGAFIFGAIAGAIVVGGIVYLVTSKMYAASARDSAALIESNQQLRERLATSEVRGEELQQRLAHVERELTTEKQGLVQVRGELETERNERRVSEQQLRDSMEQIQQALRQQGFFQQPRRSRVVEPAANTDAYTGPANQSRFTPL